MIVGSVQSLFTHSLKTPYINIQQSITYLENNTEQLDKTNYENEGSTKKSKWPYTCSMLTPEFTIHDYNKLTK